jgi:hypothetical protein
MRRRDADVLGNRFGRASPLRRERQARGCDDLRQRAGRALPSTRNRHRRSLRPQRVSADYDCRDVRGRDFGRCKLTPFRHELSSHRSRPKIRHWNFFPTGSDGWGHMPLWGFAENAPHSSQVRTLSPSRSAAAAKLRSSTTMVNDAGSGSATRSAAPSCAASAARKAWRASTAAPRDRTAARSTTSCASSAIRCTRRSADAR